MDILLYSDIIEKYLENSHKALKGPLDLLRSNIFENCENRLILSKKYIEFLEQHFSPAHPLHQRFVDFYTEIFDTKSKYVKYDGSPFVTKKDEFEFLYNSHINNLFVAFTETIDSASEFQDKIIVSMSQVSKPNPHWLCATITANGIASVRYDDFSDEDQIKIFIEGAISFLRNTKYINIFDRYVNFDSHNRFDCFSESKYKVHYFTLSTKDANAFYHVSKKIKNKFGTGTKVFHTRNADHIHERAVWGGNLIVKCDDDFSKINCSTKTWSIEVSFQKDNSMEKLNKKKLLFVEYT